MKINKRKLFSKYFFDFFGIAFACLIIIIILVLYMVFSYAKKQETSYKLNIENTVTDIFTSASSECSDSISLISKAVEENKHMTDNMASGDDYEVRNLFKPIITVISSCMTNSKYISGIYVYSGLNNSFISGTGMDATGNYSKYFWYNNFDSVPIKGGCQTQLIRDDKGLNYIAIFQYLNGNNINQNRDALIILLDSQSLSYNIKKLNLNNAFEVSLWSPFEKKLLFSTSENNNTFYNTAEWNKKGTIHAFISKYSYSVDDISDLNWKSVIKYDNANFLFNTHNPAMWLIFFLIIMLIIIVAAISYKRAKSIYQPIDDIMHILRDPANSISVQSTSAYKKYSEIQYIFERILMHINENTNVKHELEKSISQLNSTKEYALQAQIQPHFIYNTLEIINLEACSLLGNDNIISEMICSLSDILRVSFQFDGHFISIEDEYIHIKQYIHIQSIRYEDTFETVWDWDKKINNCFITKLVLQPLVENSIIHGIIPAKRHCTLKISAHEHNGNIIFTIEDDGVGIENEKLKQIRQNIRTVDTMPKQHIGISNVNTRIKTIFGDKYGLSISSENGITKCEIIIPKLSKPPE